MNAAARSCVCALLALSALTGAPFAQKPPDRWPSFRGPFVRRRRGRATARQLERQREPQPALDHGSAGAAHSSPIVWGDRLFVTTAISSQANATFKPGLYGEGTASEDKSVHRWVVMALDRRTGAVAWRQTAARACLAKSATSRRRMPTPRPPPTAVASSRSSGRRDYAFDMDGRLLEEGPRDSEHRRVRPSRVRVGHRELSDHLQEPGDRSVRHAERIVRARGGHRHGRHGVEDDQERAAVLGRRPCIRLRADDPPS